MRTLDMHCIDCSVDTEDIREFFMVHDKLWEQAVPNKHDREQRVLCVGCLETRLGRTLTATDFTSARVNRLGIHSERLLQRLTASS